MTRTVNNDHPEYGNVTAPRTAGLLVEIFPIGVPGRVGIAVHNTGPEHLTQDEVVQMLVSAAIQVDMSATWHG